MIELKAGVKLHPDTHPRVLEALARAEAVFARWHFRVVVTSWADSVHKKDSLHYSGRAIDLRVHHVPEKFRDAVVSALATSLGPDFDVLWESKDSPNEHLHVEYDP